jgi:hypothetical protein
MPSDTLSQAIRLAALLDEALALADSAGLSIAAIHIDEAIASLTQTVDTP